MENNGNLRSFEAKTSLQIGRKTGVKWRKMSDF